MNTRTHYRRVAFSFLMAILAAAISHAQDKSGEIDKIFSWATPKSPGCVCAVSENGKTISRAYGSADLDREVPLTENSVFDIGSLQKQFVAASILILVEEKKLSLSDDIRKYIPELPDYEHKITINHLMTHTSGIRDWVALEKFGTGRDDIFEMILRQRGLNFAPGEEWSYSNSNYVLLKQILTRISGMSVAEFTNKRLFEPLKMKSTAFHQDMRDVIRNRAMGYEKQDGSWNMAMRLENDRGGGVLFSTAGDLLIWNDALASGRLGKFVTEKLEEPTKLNNGRQLKYARGLFVETYNGTKEIWHSGGAAGYHSWLGRFPGKGLSAAVLCNSDTKAASGLAEQIVGLFIPDDGAQSENGPPPIAAAGVDVASLELDSKAGLYFSESTDEPLRLAIDHGRLRVANGPALIATAKDHFKRWGAALEFMSQDEFEVVFKSGNEFEMKSMEGKITRYRRAQSYTPTANELKAFAGRYESKELGTVFEVEPKEGSLLIRLEHMPSKNLELKPVARDVFQISRMTMRFLRNKSGKVVAIDYSNPVLSNVSFTAVN